MSRNLSTGISLVPIILAFFLAFLAFTVVDCLRGKPTTYLGKVMGKEHRLPYTDSDGDWHIEEWHVYVQHDGGETFDVMTKRDTYFSVSNGQAVLVAVRKGRMTDTPYMARIISTDVRPEQ